MTSRFGWLDHDESQRAKMMEIVKLFQDEGSVDELGIGSIRDAFSNSFFPGTSVLHTRARYLFFIPWQLRDVARRGKSVQESRASLRSAEVSLIRALLAGGEKAGVIGSQAQDRLKTMPSQTYWPALGRLGLLRWDVSIDGYFRNAVAEVRRHSEVTAHDTETTRLDLGLLDSIPPTPEDLLKETTFTLTGDEAAILRGVFVRLDKQSLTRWFAAHSDTTAGDWVWQHPQIGELPDEQRARVDHARRLHHVWHGAPLLYNLMLARLCDDEMLTSFYEDELDSWEIEVDQSHAMESWEQSDFWVLARQLNPRIGVPTQNFVSRWIELVGAGEHRGDRARALVKDRELRLKGARSRITNPAAREGWTGGAGLSRLDYRWGVAQRFLNDMYAGLQQAEVV